MKNKILIMALSVALAFVIAFAGFGVYATGDIQVGDTNGDGKIDLLDVVHLAQYVAEWDVELAGTASSKPTGTDEIKLTELEKAMYGVDPDLYNIGLKNKGDSSRIAALMKKAEKGGSYKIAVLGGSISQGAGASASFFSYGNLVCEWWASNFPNATFEFVNAGFGSTNPEMACYRMGEDLLKTNPDFVVVDFSVNTYLDYDLYNTYSTILYKILSQKNSPAVMSIDFTSCDRQKHDLAMQYVKTTSVPNKDITDAVNAYNLPAMSYHNYVWEKINKKVIKWPDIGADYIHPNDNGHMIAASIITSYLKNVLGNLPKESTDIISPQKPTTDDYLNLDYVINTANGVTFSGGFTQNANDHTYRRGWTYKPDGEASKLTVPISNGKKVVVFMSFVEGTVGQIEVKDSSGAVKTISLNDAKTPTLVELGAMKGSLTFNPTIDNGGFTIYGIGVKN